MEHERGAGGGGGHEKKTLFDVLYDLSATNPPKTHINTYKQLFLCMGSSEAVVVNAKETETTTPVMILNRVRPYNASLYVRVRVSTCRDR